MQSLPLRGCIAASERRMHAYVAMRPKALSCIPTYAFPIDLYVRASSGNG